MGQKEFADLVGCSPATIQSIELGPQGIDRKTGKVKYRLKLSEDLAIRIAAETGISLEWLLEGDPRKTPLNHVGEPYKKEDFEEMVSLNESPKGDREDTALAARMNTAFLLTAYVRIASSAMRQGKLRLLTWKAKRAIAALAQDFGEDEIQIDPLVWANAPNENQFPAFAESVMRTFCAVIRPAQKPKPSRK